MEITIKPDEIKDWETGVAVGIELKGKLDSAHLDLGLLADTLCPVRKAGRRAGDNKSQTITALAGDIGVDRNWLSHAANNWEFFKNDLDSIPPDASINMLANARKVAGWSTGQTVTKAMMAKAIKYLEGKVDVPKPPPPTALKYVRQARAKLSKTIDHVNPLPNMDDVALVEKAKDHLDEVDSHYDDEDEEDADDTAS